MKFLKLNVLVASQNRGMQTEQIADRIDRQQLHIRKDGQPVTSKQVQFVAILICLSKQRSA